MNYGELRAFVASYLHRTDLGTEVDGFIDQARTRINRRFCTDLASFNIDTDTNDVLTESPELYQYAALAEGYGFLHNGDAMTTYNQRWETEADRQNITDPGGATDPYKDAPPFVRIHEVV